MADFLAAKTVSEVVQRRWAIPVDSDDGAVSVAVSASGVTVGASTLEGNDLVLTLSAGTAAATGTIVATVTTSRGRTLIETLYIPIVQSAAQVADTARNYVEFALRKIIGNGETPSADEMTDALERLNAMIAEWRAGGADIGAAYPLVAESVIYCPDWAVSALRHNLLLECYALYDAEPTLNDVRHALRGMQLVKHKNLPVDRAVDFT